MIVVLPPARASPRLRLVMFRGRNQIEARTKSKRVRKMRKLLMVLSFLTAFVPMASAMAQAQDSSPYVVGHWLLNDSFQEFTGETPNHGQFRVHLSESYRFNSYS
jgi:hypothetical protein